MAEEKTVNAAEEMKKYFDGVIKGIDCLESTEWETQTREVSLKIREALISQHKEVKDKWCEKRFIDYCNWVKSLLAVYNFGNLPAVDELELKGASDKETAKDKEYIKEAIKNILRHVKTVGFDITPYLTQDDCVQIFGDGDENSKKITVPVTMSATTVFTTLVYFRRAYSRIGLFKDDDLKLEPGEAEALSLISAEGVKDLSDCVAQAVAQIMYYFADFIVNGDQSRKFGGWGFTLSPQLTQAVTLNDTYAVVDALSRFDDAFNQTGTKRDSYFLKKVNEYGEAIDFKSLVTYCRNAMYRTAYNTYVRDEDRLYGKSLFYITNSKKNASVAYKYTPINYEQIASSNRSSALFNPLYVAMITMYGYNEKEIVIRKFMDDSNLAKQYYDLYEPHLDANNKMTELPEGVKKSISEYSKELEWFNGKIFAKEVQLIIKEHKDKTASHGMGEEWSRYYDIARVFQKYLETQLPNGELMKIAEYRDYLNSTKDAIDQIQVAYRKFDDSQRLGIVDTDYLMFSTLDFNTDSVTISKLNKANIPANYLRPLLLSSKIMIVSALTKYPQSDMEDLYEAIKASRHRKTIIRGAKKNVSSLQNDDNTEWLWNEDTVDMNSTARHCETIMYDYFDYYEKYELSYKALTNIKRSTNNVLDEEKINGDGSLKFDKLFNEDGSLKFDELFAQDGKMSEFKHMVLNLTHQNVEKVQLIFNERLKDRDKKLKAKDDEITALKAAHEKDIQKLKDEFKKEFNKSQTSIAIGDTVRVWIREEAQRFFKEMLSYMILNNLNGQQDDDKDFALSKLMDYRTKEGGLVDGMFGEANKLSRDIIDDYNNNADAAEKTHGKKLREAIAMQSMFGGALDDLLRLDVINDIVRGDKASLNDKNSEIQKEYIRRKADRREGKYDCAVGKETDKTDTAKKEENNN